MSNRMAATRGHCGDVGKSISKVGGDTIGRHRAAYVGVNGWAQAGGGRWFGERRGADASPDRRSVTRYRAIAGGRRFCCHECNCSSAFRQSQEGVCHHDGGYSRCAGYPVAGNTRYQHCWYSGTHRHGNKKPHVGVHMYMPFTYASGGHYVPHCVGHEHWARTGHSVVQQSSGSYRVSSNTIAGPHATRDGCGECVGRIAGAKHRRSHNEWSRVDRNGVVH